MRQLDTITDSMDMNWTNSGRQWKTEGMLQSMGLQSQTQLSDRTRMGQQNSPSCYQDSWVSWKDRAEANGWKFGLSVLLYWLRWGGGVLEGTHQESIYYPVSPSPHPSSFLSFLSSAERYHALKSLMRKPETWGFASLHKAVLLKFH